MFSVVYFLLVLATCITFILGSIRYFRTDIYIRVNDTHKVSMYDRELAKHKNEKVALITATHDLPFLHFFNLICIIFFTTDLVLRFVTCPQRRQFFRNFLNVVDLVIVVAMWIAFLLVSIEVDLTSSDSLLWTYLVVKGCIILRLLRLFRLGKHVSGLKVLYLAMKASLQELGLLLLMFMITTSLFGSVIFYAEFFEQSAHFNSVAIAIWWAVITLTTVGYGDFYPTTPFGYVVGGACSICGLLLLSMPIAIIATNFNNYYNKNKTRQKQLKRKNDIFSKLRSLFSAKSRKTATVTHFGLVKKNITPLRGREKTELSHATKIRVKSAFMDKLKPNKT